MASSQQPSAANQFGDKEKAAIDEALKEAQSVLEKNIENEKASQDQRILVTGVMKKLKGRVMSLQKSYEWKGKFLAKPTPTLGETGEFVHEGIALGIPEALGSKGAVIYGNDKALPQLGWLLAWDKPALLTNKFDKVYVEAGNLSRMLKMEEKEIEQKLDASGSVSRYWDSETAAVTAAKMTNNGGNMALVGAVFDVSTVPLPPQ